MFYKQIRKKQRITLFSIGVLLLVLTAIDRWLPYALISHYKRPVIEHPPILDRYNAKAETFTFKTRDRIVTV
ncbi:MAG: hypothetical protein KME10_28035 [Plectolyngbya sp. WJT66-NPBG17]|jgi:hypothetical protein|nr:hypothetical protein [Plectolyngbya sp. WJT66-NPBG17]